MPQAPDITQTLPETQAAYAALQEAALAQGITFTLNDYGTLRTDADTTAILGYRQADFNAAVASGAIPADTTLQTFRPIAPFGKSYHDFGAAFDVSPQSWPAGMSYATAVATLGGLASDCGLRWGHSFGDDPHFELAMTLAGVSAMWSNWQASGETDDSLTGTQYVEVAVESVPSWILIAGVALSLVALFGKRLRHGGSPSRAYGG